jgi:hypothetical protein
MLDFAINYYSYAINEVSIEITAKGLKEYEHFFLSYRMSCYL